MSVNLEDLILDTEELLDKKDSIPPYPAIALDIKKEIEKGYNSANFDRITELVEKDVALAGKIIELMNSPFYRRSRGEVTSIRTALNFMGLQSFYGVALTMIVQKSIPKDDLAAYEKFWSHSINTANICKLLAGSKKNFFELQDELYLVGLFHDFGVPFLSLLYPAYKELMDKALIWGENIETLEIEQFKTNHCIAGYVIAKSWRLPEAVKEVILTHHSNQFSDSTGKETTNILKAILILAELLLSQYQSLTDVGQAPAKLIIPSSIPTVLQLTVKEIIKKKEEIFTLLKEQSAVTAKNR
jgi:HD-like signal output (HDOD) protein